MGSYPEQFAGSSVFSKRQEAETRPLPEQRFVRAVRRGLGRTEDHRMGVVPTGCGEHFSSLRLHGHDLELIAPT